MSIQTGLLYYTTYINLHRSSNLPKSNQLVRPLGPSFLRMLFLLKKSSSISRVHIHLTMTSILYIRAAPVHHSLYLIPILSSLSRKKLSPLWNHTRPIIHWPSNHNAPTAPHPRFPAPLPTWDLSSARNGFSSEMSPEPCKAWVSFSSNQHRQNFGIFTISTSSFRRSCILKLVMPIGLSCAMKLFGINLRMLSVLPALDIAVNLSVTPPAQGLETVGVYIPPPPLIVLVVLIRELSPQFHMMNSLLWVDLMMLRSLLKRMTYTCKYNSFLSSFSFLSIRYGLPFLSFTSVLISLSLKNKIQNTYVYSFIHAIYLVFVHNFKMETGNTITSANVTKTNITQVQPQLFILWSLPNRHIHRLDLADTYSPCTYIS